MAETLFGEQPLLKPQPREREQLQEPTRFQRIRQKLKDAAALVITAPVWFPVRHNEPQSDTTQLGQASIPKNQTEKQLLNIDAPVPHSTGPMLHEAQRALVEPNHPIRSLIKGAVKGLWAIKTGHYQP